MTDRKKTVVYVEDCQEDFQAMERALTGSSFEVELMHLSTLEKARDYFEKLKDSIHLPDLIFLDLRVNGQPSLPLLKEIKAHTLIRTIPVLVISASDQEADILESCSFGSSAYIKKPLGLSEWRRVVSLALEFWMTVAERPYEWVGID